MDKTWPSAADCSVADLIALTSTRTSIDDYPWAAQVVDDVLLYASVALRPTIADPEGRKMLQAELARALSSGPGIVVFSSAFTDTDVVDAVSGVFDDIIDEQRAAAGIERGAAPLPDDRISEALVRLAERAPGLYRDYATNDVVDMVSQAWLGPNYALTADVHVINPGGSEAQFHRSGHLGALDAAEAARYPAHVHAMTSALTLRATIAHTDMPVESGPTMYLPHSQKYVPGYLALELSDFREYVDEHHVQLPLFKGDIVFFNPAIFHAAGSNTTRTVRRMANLLQAYSAFSRAPSEHAMSRL